MIWTMTSQGEVKYIRCSFTTCAIYDRGQANFFSGSVEDPSVEENAVVLHLTAFDSNRDRY